MQIRDFGNAPRRPLTQGMVEAYVHRGGRVGALVELRCETDFVARTPEFRTLARELAMQVAAMNPQAVGLMKGDDEDDDALLSQEYIRDPQMTVRDLIKETMSKVGERIEVKRFVRFELGVNDSVEH